MDNTIKRGIGLLENASNITNNLAIRELLIPKKKQAVIKKLNWRLILIIFVIYLLLVLDRSNLGNVYIAGFNKSFGLKGN